MCKWIRVKTVCPDCLAPTARKVPTREEDRPARDVLFDGEVFDGNMVDICEQAQELHGICTHIEQPRVQLYDYDRLDPWEQTVHSVKHIRQRKEREALNPVQPRLGAFNFTVIGQTKCDGCKNKLRSPASDFEGFTIEDGVKSQLEDQAAKEKCEAVLKRENEYVQSQWKSSAMWKHYIYMQEKLHEDLGNGIGQFNVFAKTDTILAHANTLMQKLNAKAFLMHFPGGFTCGNELSPSAKRSDEIFRKQLPPLIYHVLRLNAKRVTDVFQLEFLEQLLGSGDFPARIRCHNIADFSIPPKATANADPVKVFEGYYGLNDEGQQALHLLHPESRPSPAPAELFDGRLQQLDIMQGIDAREAALIRFQAWVRDKLIGTMLFGRGTDIPKPAFNGHSKNKSLFVKPMVEEVDGCGNTWATRPAWLELWAIEHQPYFMWDAGEMMLEHGPDIDPNDLGHERGTKSQRWKLDDQDKFINETFVYSERKVSDENKSRYWADRSRQPGRAIIRKTGARRKLPAGPSVSPPGRTSVPIFTPGMAIPAFDRLLHSSRILPRGHKRISAPRRHASSARERRWDDFFCQSQPESDHGYYDEEDDKYGDYVESRAGVD